MQKAIICDIDGTLALMGLRSPYDTSQALNDQANPAVSLILDALTEANIEIIFVSGRFEQHRYITECWLSRNGFIWNDLFLRKDGDKRKDYVVKEEIYNEKIKGKFDIQFVLEDRTRNVQMWREIGLVCLQVAEGNF